MRSKIAAVLVGTIIAGGAAVAAATPSGPTGHETDVGPVTVATLNPAGKCVMQPANSDIVQHPEKHSGWQVIGGQCP